MAGLWFIQVDHFLSVFLDVANSYGQPDGWSRYAGFSFSVVHQMNDRIRYSMSMFCKLNLTLHYQFSAKHPDWGFWNFIPLSEPRDPDRGFLLDDTLIEEV
ncbi:hypothetical protein IFM89_018208 [Coptis chinensis]|uniref:MATH domain-containing protein n=1 Tax=Coptis chinensis TaxID=261450 RepID=A0A835LW56_9MAGN|nr:hypothetical protein IFM89_018208 [Coptis chinensis]